MKKTVKICVYNKTSSKNDVLLGNGDAILDNICIECKVHENLDGTYEIDAEFIIDNEGLWQHLEEEAILKVRLDYGYEYFRITQPRKTSNRIIVYGRQVTIYETMHLWLTDVRPENQDGAGALHWILDHATGIKELEVASDIQTISTAYYMDMNMYEALHDCDQSFFNRWGGEIQRRGYTLRINQRIGTDRGVEIRSRKNLTGFEAKTNIDNVVTRIKPKGFDGITIDGFVDSKYINKYPRIKTKEIKYENVKVKGENSEEGFETLAGAQAELTRLAKLEFTENEIDVITAEYNISFVDLYKTEEYKEYVQAERVYLGDTVNVYEEKLDINVSVRAIDRVYDVLGERVEEIKLSNKDINKLHSMNDILTDILKGVQENDNSLQLYIQNIINSGIQDSYVFYNKAELVICDSPEIENAINVWRFNRGGLAHSSNGYSGPYNVAITYDGKINADMILAGLLKGNYIDARNLTVTRTDGTKTLEVTAGGDVNLNVSSLKIQSEDVATKSLVTQTADSIATKVDKNGVISSINQSPESIRLDASKIDLQGAVSAGGVSEGNYVYIAKENYNVYKDNINTMTVGTVTKDGNIVPAVFMGANGHSGGANYGALFHMGNREVLAHYNSGRNDWSEISLYSDGTIDVEPAGGLILGAGAGIGIKNHMFPHNQETIYLGYVNNPYSSMVSKEFISAFDGSKNGSVYGRDGRFYVEAGEANSLDLVAPDGSIDMRANGLIALQSPNGIFLNGNVYPYNQETIYFGQTDNPISDIYSKNYNMSFDGSHHGDLYGRSGRITLEAQADHDIYLSNPNYAVKFDVNGHFMPTMYNISNLGAAAADYRWKCIYLLSNPDISSDLSLKENIRYIDSGTDMSTFAFRDEAKSDITTNDMYEFIRDDLRLAEYRYKGTDKDTMGFIAQDIENTKIGAKLINKNEDGTLSFDSGIRISILEGALQKAIKKIEKLEAIIDELTNNDNI